MRIGPQSAEVIFGRGGIRGIALAGAAAALESRGYRIERAAGASAGALVAALIAVGYRATEIHRIVWQLDYPRLRDVRGCGRVPGVGPLLALLTRMGVYRGDRLLETFRGLLAARNVRTFSDLRCHDLHHDYRLRVLATDVTRRRTIVLPDDAGEYGVDPDEFEVALALRMSASVPFLFEPVRFGRSGRSSLIVDGGLLAGIPFALLDADRPPGRHVFGVRTRKGIETSAVETGARGLWGLADAAFHTVIAVNDRRPGDEARIIDIDCGRVRSTDFGIGAARKAMLYAAGVTAANRFLAERAATLQIEIAAACEGSGSSREPADHATNRRLALCRS